MAVEERRATRHEPITVSVTTIKDKLATFVAKPLPWRKRNDFGDALIMQYTVGINGMARDLRDEEGNITGLESHLFESVIDYESLFMFGYSDWDVDDNGELVATEPPKEQMGAFRLLDFDGQLEVLEAALAVNSLERLSHLLDPDRKSGPAIGESEAPIAAETDDGSKTELPTDSGSLSQVGQEQR